MRSPNAGIEQEEAMRRAYFSEIMFAVHKERLLLLVKALQL